MVLTWLHGWSPSLEGVTTTQNLSSTGTSLKLGVRAVCSQKDSSDLSQYVMWYFQNNSLKNKEETRKTNHNMFKIHTYDIRKPTTWRWVELINYNSLTDSGSLNPEVPDQPSSDPGPRYVTRTRCSSRWDPAEDTHRTVWQWRSVQGTTHRTIQPWM